MLMVTMKLIVLIALLCGVEGQVEVAYEEGCKCVVYHQCSPSPITSNQSGSVSENVIDSPLQVNIREQSSCDHYLDVCCPMNRIYQDNIGEQPVGVVPTTTELPFATTTCGTRNAQGIDFSITGATDGESQFGEFPWVVAIHSATNDKDPLKYSCGGSLITRSVVLTAAHCVANLSPGNVQIRAGEWDTQTLNEKYPLQDREVSKIVVHERYFAAALHNNIALLFLQSPVDEARNIGTICLPAQGEIFDNRRCFASGWGKDVYGREGKSQVILKKRELPMIPRHSCEQALRKTRLGPLFKLDPSNVCAGGEAGIDTCSGDGGSPLVCPLRDDPTHYAQAGIVSWGIGCGEGNIPGVYVNVGEFRNWIDEKISGNP